jgi:hypothetical protein
MFWWGAAGRRTCANRTKGQRKGKREKRKGKSKSKLTGRGGAPFVFQAAAFFRSTSSDITMEAMNSGMLSATSAV